MKEIEHVKKNHKLGFSIIELIMVIAIIGVLSYFVLQNKDSLLASVYENREIKNIALLQMTVQGIGELGDYRGLENKTVKGFNMFPSSMRSDDRDAIKTAWSDYGVRLEAEENKGMFGSFGDYSKNAFSMTYFEVPSSACNKLVTDSGSLFYMIEINGNTVKDESKASTSGMGSSSKKLSLTEVAGECGTELDVSTIKFYSN